MTDAWTDERIKATVTTHFVYSHLGEAANQPVSGSAEASGPTYAQRTTTKAKLLFLTLIAVGLPQQVFRLIDEFYDDDHLPFAEDEVASLRLSRSGTLSLGELFYRQQYKYLVRVLHDGEHIRYGREEYVPIQYVEQKASGSLSSGWQKVRMPTPVDRILVRRQYAAYDRDAEVDLLSEIAAVKSLSHQHVISVYGSYTEYDHLYVLLSPATKYSLKGVLSDVPKAFELLAKPERRKHFLTWPHCISTALAWLHLQGTYHGAVRPSRVLLDEQFQVSLGHFEGDDWLLTEPSAKDDLEKYQYAAPELWMRGLTVQIHGGSKAILASGGRSAPCRDQYPPRVDPAERCSNDGRNETIRSNSLESSYAFTPAFRSNSSRLQLRLADSLPNDTPWARSIESRRSNRSDVDLYVEAPHRTLSCRFDVLSKRSSASSEKARNAEAPSSRFTYAMPVETKKAVVQSWKSTAYDMRAADVFGLAAVTMDILTVLCGRTVSSFAKHRASKNRQAGRGGGLADASFHANLVQVVSWAKALHTDSEKKAKKDSGKIFQLVGPLLEEILPCFDREVKRRPGAERLSEGLQRHLRDFADTGGCHCSLEVPWAFAETNQKNKHQAESYTDTRDSPRSPKREKGKAEHSKRSTYGRNQHDTQRLEVPRNSYEESRTMTTPSLVHTPSTTRDIISELYAGSLKIPSEAQHPNSPDLYGNYEDQWANIRHSQLIPERTAQARLHEDSIRHDESLSGDSAQYDQGQSLRSPAYRRDPCRLSQYRGSAYQTAGASKTRNYKELRLYAPSDPKPPDRELPTVPSTANTSQHRDGRRPSPSYQADVAEATRMLARTLGRLDRR